MFLLPVALFAAVTSQQWVLQLGYFANLDNAQAFKRTLTEAGFEAEVLATGEPGDQRYRVISGRADLPEDLDSLREAIQRRTGETGFAIYDPRDEREAHEAVFEESRARYLLAQVGGDLPLDPSPPASIGYESGLNRTPQEAVDSMVGFTAGGLQIIPTIGLSLGYDDNVTRAPRDEIDSWFYMISPAVVAELPSDRSVLSVTAGADWIRYDDSIRDDRQRWYLNGNWAWDISSRQNLGLFATWEEGTDARGTGRRQGEDSLIPLDPDEWRRFGYGGMWDYGAVGARGRLTLRAGAYDLEYQNNREPSEGLASTRLLDRDWWYLGGTFYWRVAPKTSLLADYQYTDMNYKVAESSDSEMHTWRLGVTWDATARTTGRLTYGDQKRTFDDPFVEDFNGPVWTASIDWRPRTYSVLRLEGARSTQEPNGNGAYVLRQDIVLSWLHDWAPRFGTTVDIGFGQDDYRPGSRKDDLFYWGVGGRYTFNPHFRFGASINGYDRSSDLADYDYQRIVYMLTLEASF